jgi:hypothetical protein
LWRIKGVLLLYRRRIDNELWRIQLLLLLLIKAGTTLIILAVFWITF